MPPIRTRAPRFSSPLLPERLLPPSPLPPSSDPPTSDDDSEEEERVKLNRVVCSLRDIANADMHNYKKVLAWKHAKEDYEDAYGKFVPDEDAATVMRRKRGLSKMLYDMRQDLEYCRVATDSATIAAYFEIHDAFESEFGPFRSHDGLDDRVARRQAALGEWEYLMEETGGDLTKAYAIAARDFAFVAPNPYPAGSDARFAFDSMLRRVLVEARFDLHNDRAFPPTVDNPTFLFQLNNPYAARTSGSLNYHCYRRTVRKVMWDRVYTAQCRAGVEPTGTLEMPTIAPAVFYGHS
ncbi:hypothetical protein C8R44DRAFT_746447 [Mycena epipterygia]|nr:hypothetical protein C8R44DRAFT_752924 [Mycena epipterygia]KAJ7104770.1 hypothetical protein C8R44DRAFT_746447 [Mycena epipterygia]